MRCVFVFKLVLSHIGSHHVLAIVNNFRLVVTCLLVGFRWVRQRNFLLFHSLLQRVHIMLALLGVFLDFFSRFLQISLYIFMGFFPDLLEPRVVGAHLLLLSQACSLLLWWCLLQLLLSLGLNSD